MNSAALSPLQRDLLAAFFRREQRFRLTGGGALAGFHLGHRRTEDLDLFSAEPALDEGDRALLDAARELGATVERVQSSESFRRRLVHRGSEALVVDLAHDESPHSADAEMLLDGIRGMGAVPVAHRGRCAGAGRDKPGRAARLARGTARAACPGELACGLSRPTGPAASPAPPRGRAESGSSPWRRGSCGT